MKTIYRDQRGTEKTAGEWIDDMGGIPAVIGRQQFGKPTPALIESIMAESGLSKVLSVNNHEVTVYSDGELELLVDPIVTERAQDLGQLTRIYFRRVDLERMLAMLTTDEVPE
ncbi:MAG: hypothetical protein KAJ73_00150 [Zetaproteobacteria bacterium]|nr:hypothetical protein [Zetaproteobacteria bacterium]